MILSIISFEKVPDESHYIFHLNVQYEDWNNTISKRYSEFLELHRVMKLIQQNTGADLPEFPKKMKIKHFFRVVSEQDLENRRKSLENYMRELESGEITRHSRYFVDFIGFPMRFREAWLAQKPI